MVAIMLSLVYRQMGGLSDVLRMLEQEGLMWAGAQLVSRQALSDRLKTPTCEPVCSPVGAGIRAPARSTANGGGDCASVLAECPEPLWCGVVSRWFHPGGAGQTA